MATPLLDVQNVSKRFGDRVLFENISFSIAEGQRVGLIAQNGTGKSTLLAMLTGGESVDSGDIVYRNGVRVGFLRQEPVFPAGATVLEACFSGSHPDEESQLKAKQILTQLRIKDLQQPIHQLSGGQQKRVALAQVLISDPDFLVLDEPTNHLDLPMVEWLEGFLSRGNKTLLMVTHDRFFLDKVCSVILELDNRTMFTYRGSYAYYLEKRQERLDTAMATLQHANNLYRRELEWMRRMPQARGHKARYREEAFYELEKLAKQRIEERQLRLKASNVYIGSKIFECRYVSKRYDDKVLLERFYYNFARYEKMGIVGENGTGKSTFLKMLLGRVAPDEGSFDIGETVRFGYFSQEGLAFNEQQKVIDVVRDIAEYVDLGQGRHLTASQLLQHFLFTPDQQYNYVHKLSGGEKRKLYLCTVLMKSPNFLILDEPTNDLDIKTLQVLEEYLQDFPGCVMVVSHDRYFMDKVVDHLLVFEGQGRIKDFPGNYTQYREWLKLAPSETETPGKLSNSKAGATASFKAGAASASKGTASKGSVSGNAASANAAKSAEPDRSPRGPRDPNAAAPKRKMSFKEKSEFAQLDLDIARLNQEKAEIEAVLSGGQATVAQITEMGRRLPQLKQELDEKEFRWLELSELA